jgi:hypothetical protein
VLPDRARGRVRECFGVVEDAQVHAASLRATFNALR